MSGLTQAQAVLEQAQQKLVEARRAHQRIPGVPYDHYASRLNLESAQQQFRRAAQAYEALRKGAA